MRVTGDILAGSDATAFGRHFFGLVRSISSGDWVRYRDVYNRAVAELPENAFVQWLAGHPRRRSKLKHVLQAAASSFPDVERRKDGAAQSARVFYRTRPPAFDIVTRRREVARLFGVWRKAMMHGGRVDGGVWETPEGLLVITLPRPSPQTLGRRVALGYDSTSATWTVQINQPTEPETHNVHSAVATSPGGRPMLLRQGTLQRNRRNPTAITGRAFREATGLRPVEVTHGGWPSPRVWYPVAWLDEPLERIRMATARFAEACEAARELGTEAYGAADEERLDELFGPDEDDGGHTVPGSTTTGREVPHIQGAVWRKLRSMLRRKGIGMTKPRHRDGYEVDGLISLKPVPVLLEIKTSAASAVIQTGVGQLTLYPALLPRLQGARRMLLARGVPRPSIARAVRDGGVELHGYEVDLEAGRVVDVRFDPAFLAAVGLD